MGKPISVKHSFLSRSFEIGFPFTAERCAFDKQVIILLIISVKYALQRKSFMLQRFFYMANHSKAAFLLRKCNYDMTIAKHAFFRISCNLYNHIFGIFYNFWSKRNVAYKQRLIQNSDNKVFLTVYQIYPIYPSHATSLPLNIPLNLLQAGQYWNYFFCQTLAISKANHQTKGIV